MNSALKYKLISFSENLCTYIFEKKTCVPFSAERLADFDVKVGNSFDQATYDGSSFTTAASVSGALAAGESRTIIFDAPVTGRYVGINLRNPGVLTICELQVF